MIPWNHSNNSAFRALAIILVRPSVGQRDPG